jgi:hypothetical protein
VHIANAGEQRENTAIRRWLTANPENGLELARACGLFQTDAPAGWWCGLNLLRRDVFGDTADGDVDLIVGPLEFDLDDDGWRSYEARAALGPNAHPDKVLFFSALLAAGDGHVIWPPRLDQIAAIEAKASWFQVEPADKWKRIITGKKIGLRGQLDYLLRQGVDRVAFFHLAATAPRPQPAGNPWLAAGADARSAQRSFPTIFQPEEIPWCGYFRTIVGAVAHAPEDVAGAGGVLGTVIAPPANPAATGHESWRNRFVTGSPDWVEAAGRLGGSCCHAWRAARGC